MLPDNFDVQGLTDEQVLTARKQYGLNQLAYKNDRRFFDALKSLIREPMLLFLLAAASIYFISGDMADGLFLSAAIILVAAISLYQDARSRNALEKLKRFTQPTCTVIRNGAAGEIKSEDLVFGDMLMVAEGTSITADGTIIHSNDFSVNESILTGESLPVYKDQSKDNNLIFSGTTVVSGLAIATVIAVGNATRLGRIGKSLEDIQEEKTPLELQIAQFVKKMVIAGVVAFIIVWVVNFFRSFLFLDSLLKALTLAMSILPEEIPVAFTTFMALGAWRLMKMGIVVKQMKTVETLGSATVICTDKTGTLTENNMRLAKVFVLATQKISDAENIYGEAEKEVVRLGMWASEPIPFDPMETALHDAYSKTSNTDERSGYKIIHEYPLSGKPPMMTHVFENNHGARIVAAKGAPEALVQVADLSDNEKKQIAEALDQLAAAGYRVLGTGSANFNGYDFPVNQQAFHFQFKGLLAFYDPPKKNIHSVLEGFYAAGIAVKIVTGDNAVTTASIARQIGFRGFDKTMSGDDLLQANESSLKEAVLSHHVFTRMFPEAKLKIINALKAGNQIVAMTGDGVNDGPALKAAHIGIAMGRKGTEIAKQAASLILLEDDLSKMVEAVAMGRKIYANLKKAIQYIISIHIPIVLTVVTPLALGWIYPNIFSPVHIIFLELIMGPTCSIIYENEPMEKNTMIQKPRPLSSTFFNWKELITSIFQGAMITAATLWVYQYAVSQAGSEALTRSMVFTTLISANVFLTLVNRSFYYSVLTTLKYKNKLVPLIIFITLTLLGMLIFIQPLALFFKFETLSLSQLCISGTAGFISVIWYEAVKWRKRRVTTISNPQPAVTTK